MPLLSCMSRCGMREIWAIIRRDAVKPTREALDAIGFSSMTIHSVWGRGRQKGQLLLDGDQSFLPPVYSNQGLRDTGRQPTAIARAAASEAVTDGPAVAVGRGPLFVPKKMLLIVAPDEDIEKIIETIMRVNRSGAPGDGKIFVFAIGESHRVRTGEESDASLT